MKDDKKENKDIVFNEIKSPKPGVWFHFEARESLNKLIGHFETQVDTYNQEEVFTIYKIVIGQGFRRKGYGTKIISYCENLARERSLKKILCLVKPFDKTLSENELKCFYKKNGFYFEIDGDTLYAIKNLES